MHCLLEAAPVTLAKAFRDDDVERLTQGFGVGKTEDPLRPLVPEGDQAFRIGIDDRVGRVAHQGPVEPVDVGFHRVTSSRPLLKPDAFGLTLAAASPWRARDSSQARRWTSTGHGGQTTRAAE